MDFTGGNIRYLERHCCTTQFSYYGIADLKVAKRFRFHGRNVLATGYSVKLAQLAVDSQLECFLRVHSSSAMTLRRPFEVTAEDLPVPHRPPAEFATIEPLLKLCASGKLYEVEAWIANGQPLQFPPSDDRKLRRKPTPLQIAVTRGFHSLAALLLANGYDPNGDYDGCLSSAVRAKDREMVELLLRFGADPLAIDFSTVLATCDRQLMDQFVAAGIDPCHGNAVARAAISGRRPILGFIKQYRDRFPGLQRQIDIALHAFAKEGSVRGVALMLWVGADPHADVPSSAYEKDGVRGIGETAFESALWGDKPEVVTLVMKRPIPKTKVDWLLRLAAERSRPEVVKRLLNEGANPNHTAEENEPALRSFVSKLVQRYTPRLTEEQDRGLKCLELVLKAGAKWNLSERGIKWLRRDLAAGDSRVVVRMLDLLREYDAVSGAQLHELTRTPSVRKVLKGHTRHPRIPFTEFLDDTPVSIKTPYAAPSRRGYWKRHWSQR